MFGCTERNVLASLARCVVRETAFSQAECRKGQRSIAAAHALSTVDLCGIQPVNPCKNTLVLVEAVAATPVESLCSGSYTRCYIKSIISRSVQKFTVAELVMIR